MKRIIMLTAASFVLAFGAYSSAAQAEPKTVAGKCAKKLGGKKEPGFGWRVRGPGSGERLYKCILASGVGIENSGFKR